MELRGTSRSASTVVVPPGRAASHAAPGGKRKIAGEAWASLAEDPFSVQFLGPWFWSLLPGHSPLEDSIPWMTFRAIRWLRSYVRPGMAAFEYGSGGSTMFLAKRIRTLVTIESDPTWYEVVSRAVRAAGITNADVRLVPPEVPHAAKSPRGSVDYEAPEMAGRTFEAYARSIDAYPDGSFDLVCVDGYARPACIARALPKIRGGGYLLLDNSDWTVYRDVIASLGKYPRTDFGGVGPFQATSWRTSVWRI